MEGNVGKEEIGGLAGFDMPYITRITTSHSLFHSQGDKVWKTHLLIGLGSGGSIKESG